MICPECKKKGKKSIVYPGIGSITLAYYPPFYDEKGRFHHHDGNITTIPHRCSNGHNWVEKNSGSCWCGWPDEKEDK